MLMVSLNFGEREVILGEGNFKGCNSISLIASRIDLHIVMHG